MQFILCLVYLLHTLNITYLSHTTIGSFLVMKTLKLLFDQFTDKAQNASAYVCDWVQWPL